MPAQTKNPKDNIVYENKFFLGRFLSKVFFSRDNSTTGQTAIKNDTKENQREIQNRYDTAECKTKNSKVVLDELKNKPLPLKIENQNQMRENKNHDIQKKDLLGLSTRRVAQPPHSFSALVKAFPDINKTELNKLRIKEDLYQILSGEFHLDPEFLKEFYLESLIGDGAYGLVFSAITIKSGQRVSVKLISTESIPSNAWIYDPEVKRLVPQELFFIKSLSHPNIIKFIAYYEHQPYIYLVTEFFGDHWTASNPILKPTKNPGIKKQSGTPSPQPILAPFVPQDHRLLTYATKLNQLFKQVKQPPVLAPCDLFECLNVHENFPLSIIQKVFSQLVDVVSFLHRNGIVHKDIKDENVLIDSTYRIKLADFGSSASASTENNGLTNLFTGTLYFASPEILSQEYFGAFEADIWALGVLLFTLCFRRSPFESSSDLINGVYYIPDCIKSKESDLVDLIDGIFKVNPKERMPIEKIVTCSWLRKQY